MTCAKPAAEGMERKRQMRKTRGREHQKDSVFRGEAEDEREVVTKGLQG